MSPEPVDDVEAPYAVMAEHDQGFFAAYQFEVGKALRYRAHGNEFRPRKAGEGMFFRLADIDQSDRFPVCDPLVGLGHGDLGLATGMHSL